MPSFSYDPHRCTGCGTCAFVCPLHLIVLEEGHPVMPEENARRCTSCGQCVAFCPTDASNQTISEGVDLEHVLPFNVGDAYVIDGALKSRRSYRTFAQRPVSRHLIDEILRVAHMAPTARNNRTYRWIVLENQRKVHGFIKAAYEWLKTSAKDNEKLSKRYDFDAVAARIENGQDPFFRRAPAVVFFIGKKDNHWGECDSGIATTYFNLAAEARNIGCTFAGIGSNFAKASPQIKEYLGVKEDEEVLLGLFFGHKTVMAHRVPSRGPIDVTYL